ncbi:alpha/beta hydrolase [Streptoalloteichus hindustanus]|uniref:Chlorophyllase enzyme n=1 Tax=Streptoalloteichus hindustanus TaxID=2017 RepID=A0A1M5CQX3_STRHI|nr:hypothetical protein [Streptoalloteichus hindustanus]SHF57155.1 hypothetical protein SAMN05444320_104130 [Streptoalloteichus hindustanus]
MRTRTRLLLAAVAAAVIAPLVPFAASAATPEVPDPLAPGEHPVAVADYTLGDEAFKPTNFPWPVEITGQIHYPTDSKNGPYPLVVLLHGRHSPCYVGKETRLKWPCTGDEKPIPSYLGYTELAKSLASHGYAVLSISANGINAKDNQDAEFGQPARGELTLKHLDLWRSWRNHAKGPIPTQALRSLDLNNIGLMGHSRGGEGMVNAVEQNAMREESQRHGIAALLPLAATDFSRRVPTGLPMAALLPACDDDMYELPGVHYYDDGRYRAANDRGVRHTVTVLGANHNYFNSVWSPSAGLPGSVDDWKTRPGSPCDPAQSTRLTEQQQRNVGTAYMGTFFRYYLGNETQFAPLWKGQAGVPRSLAPAQAYVSYHPSTISGKRKDINRFASVRTVNELGGDITVGGQLKATRCGGYRTDAKGSCLHVQQTSDIREPHRGWGVLGVDAHQLTWTSPTDSLTNAIPAAHSDVRSFKAVQLRAAVDFTNELNPVGKAQDMRVELVDAAGKSASAKVSAFSRGLDYPPVGPDGDVVPHLLFHQVHVPLNAFTGVNLAQVSSVRLAFDATPTGSIVVADLAFTA